MPDRFSQIEPKLLFACDGYHYAGKALDRRDVVAELAAGLPSLLAVVIIPYLNAEPDLSALAGAVHFDHAIAATPPVETFLVSASTTRSIFCFPAEQQALPNASSMALGEQRCSMSRNCACKVM